MAVTREDIARDLLQGQEYPVVLVVQDTSETTGGLIKSIIPYIQAGFTYIAVDTYHYTILSNKNVDIPSFDEVDKLVNTISPGTISQLGNQKVAVYHLNTADIEE